ncbi:MAG: hypothetical protein MUE78_11690 [Ilumatobacteraceae bacterium]|nr:hypothetical protein [Ilumatobacteraceae bacterium]
MTRLDGAGRLVDVVVHVPLGLVVTAQDRLPDAALRVHTRVRERIVLARFLGELAVRQAGVEVARRWADRTTTPPTAPPASPDRSTEVVSATEPAPAPTPDLLPIAGYDSLPASHVLDRLEGLDDDDLEVIAAYELAHRRRRTVLARIEQLRS